MQIKRATDNDNENNTHNETNVSILKTMHTCKQAHESLEGNHAKESLPICF